MTKVTKSKRVSRGLGDTVHKVIKASGAEIIVRKISRGKPCSECQKRREMLNSKFPYKQ